MAHKKTVSLKILLSMLVVLGLCFSYQGWSQSEPIGTVLTVSGQVTAETMGSKPRALKRRDPVFERDIISTASGSRVRFKLIDDSTYVLQENSIFTIEEYNYSGSEDGTEVADFYFTEGVMEFVSGYIGKQDTTKFRIDTEFAAIGLRGSGGIIRTSSEGTQVFVTSGQLTATNRQGGPVVIINTGETTTIGEAGESQTEQGNSTDASQTMDEDTGDDLEVDQADTDSEDGEGSESDEQTEESDSEAEGGEEVAAEEADSEDGTEESSESGVAGSEAASDTDTVTDASISAAEIYAELLPDAIEPTQDDLQQALNEAIEANPVLYAELVTVAIDMGLAAPEAAMTATEALGGSAVSEEVITEIFFVATEGITDAAEVEAAIISAEGSPLVVEATDPSPVTVGSDSVSTTTPVNNATIPTTSASPAQ